MEKAKQITAAFLLFILYTTNKACHTLTFWRGMPNFQTWIGGEYNEQRLKELQWTVFVLYTVIFIAISWKLWLIATAIITLIQFILSKIAKK